MKVKLHRCNAQWVRIEGHPCWKVEKALIDQGIEYERVTGPGMPWQRKRRMRLIELTGGYLYPAIEFEDGTAYRAESKEMAARIRAGTLFDRPAAAPGAEAGDAQGTTAPSP
jgi:hypothetical protein